MLHKGYDTSYGIKGQEIRIRIRIRTDAQCSPMYTLPPKTGYAEGWLESTYIRRKSALRRGQGRLYTRHTVARVALNDPKHAAVKPAG
jgi:hypothetical protein